MQNKSRTKVIFKDYSPNQILLLPPSLEEMIDPNHPVRVINQVIDSLDIDVLIKKYEGGGCSSYHPRLLLKLLVYGYLSNQYSSRKIEQESVLRTIESIDKALKGKQIDKKVKQKPGYARKNWPENLKKYEQQEKILGNRNSYSKTDPDATFMRMKEDHMLNGQLKPGYNLQISTENQYILGYTIHQTTNDTTTLQPHMESLNDNLGKMPDTLVADAGYGSEENYEYLENNDVEAFVKYQYFHKEQSKKWKDDPYRTDNLPYDEKDDSYTCPTGRKMDFIRERVRITDNGFKQVNRLYQAQNCNGCPVREACNKSKGNRRIEINPKLNHYKPIIRERLTSERGIKYRSKRPVEVWM